MMSIICLSRICFLFFVFLGAGLQLLEKQTVAFLKRSDSEAGLTAPLPLLSPGAVRCLLVLLLLCAD